MESQEEDVCDSLKIADQNWKQLIENAKKMGYREGIIEGKESVYQESFNEGYKCGFKFAKCLGVYKGIIEATQQFSDLTPQQKTVFEVLDTDKEVSSIREKPERALCQMCKDDSLLNQTVEKISSEQSTIGNNAITKLEEEYGNFITDHYRFH